MPVSKSKSASKDKSSARAAGKKQSKASKISSKSSNRSPAATTAHNPVDELVHTIEISSTQAAASSLHSDNGNFQNMEDTDDHSSSPRGTSSDFDLSSNNGSCSGDSEDPKEKPVDSSNQQERVSGCDHEKREKIRLKNEKKHQRQKEKRAQELHERSKGYLMSRKLEALSQQLVAMGFSSERATMALMLNEGKLEESVASLIEGNDEVARNKDTLNITSGNLKIDISSELSYISALEARYKCSKQEVERAVVACGGDLGKAEGILREQKQKETANQSNHEVVGETKSMPRAQEMSGSASVLAMQSSKNDREFSRNSAATTVPAWIEAGNRSVRQSMTLIDRLCLLKGGEKRWPAVGSGLSSSTSTPPLPVHHPYVKAEAQIGASKNEAISLRREIPDQPVEQVAFMQQPQSINGLQTSVSSPMFPGRTQRYSNNASAIKTIISSDKLLHSHSRGNLGAENRRLEQIYHQTVHNQPQYLSGPIEMLSSGFDIPWAKENASSSRSFPSEAQRLWKASGIPASFTVPSSYGLSQGGSPAQTSGLLSQMDWNGGLMPYCDYNRIDWTLHSPSGRSSELSMSPGISSSLKKGSGVGLCEIGMMQGGGSVKDISSSGGLRDWTSPFAGNDLFSAPRQLVTFPFP